MDNTPYRISLVATAAVVRAALKDSFPHQRFRVRAQQAPKRSTGPHGATLEGVRRQLIVQWTDGPTQGVVGAVLDRYSQNMNPGPHFLSVGELRALDIPKSLGGPVRGEFECDVILAARVLSDGFWSRVANAVAVRLGLTTYPLRPGAGKLSVRPAWGVGEHYTFAQLVEQAAENRQLVY